MPQPEESVDVGCCGDVTLYIPLTQYVVKERPFRSSGYIDMVAPHGIGFESLFYRDPVIVPWFDAVDRLFLPLCR